VQRSSRGPLAAAFFNSTLPDAPPVAQAALVATVGRFHWLADRFNRAQWDFLAPIDEHLSDVLDFKGNTVG